MGGAIRAGAVGFRPHRRRGLCTRRSAVVMMVVVALGFGVANAAQWAETTAAASEATGGNPLHAVEFVSSYVGWGVGAGGTVVRTDDGGATWAAQNIAFNIAVRGAGK